MQMALGHSIEGWTWKIVRFRIARAVQKRPEGMFQKVSPEFEGVTVKVKNYTLPHSYVNFWIFLLWFSQMTDNSSSIASPIESRRQNFSMIKN